MNIVFLCIGESISMECIPRTIFACLNSTGFCLFCFILFLMVVLKNYEGFSIFTNSKKKAYFLLKYCQQQII